MSVVMKTVFSLSLSGSIVILVLLLGNLFFKKKFSRQWQYYIWLIAIARLLLPIAPEGNAVGTLFAHMNQTNSVNTSITTSTASEENDAQAFPMTQEMVIQFLEYKKDGGQTILSERTVRDMAQKVLENLWIPWMAAALLLLIRKITIYQSFVKYVKARRKEISDTALLDRLAQIGEKAGVRHPVELYVNSLVSSPLLIGFFRPCIVLPTADLSEVDFTHTVWHELIHYKRRDMFYKWLVQLAICLHWFNPLVWLMGRKINRACEFSCDEAVLAKLGEQERRSYGDTLIHAVGTGGNYKDYPVSATLNESAELLKERLAAIMGFKKRSKAVVMLSAVFTAAMMMGATVMGAYVEPVRVAKIANVVLQNTPSAQIQTDNQTVRNQKAASENPADAYIDTSNPKDKNNVYQSAGDETSEKSLEDLARQYYERNMFVQFEAVFSAMDETAQRKWLDTIYTDDNIPFFSAALDGLRSSSPLIEAYAEKAYKDGAVDFFAVLTCQMENSNPLLEAYMKRAYEDGAVSFFAVLTDSISAELLQSWQTRARKEDMNIAFRSVLLDVDEEDLWVEKAQKEAEEEYQKWGITRENDDYYYQGQLVRLFYDKYDAETMIRTIRVNPLGTVDVKVTRSIRNKIMRVDYMTEEEVVELFGTDWVSGLDNEEQERLLGE